MAPERRHGRPQRRLAMAGDPRFALVQRADDSRDTVVRRLDVYKQQTSPIIKYYQEHGASVHPINGDRGIDDVQRDILQILSR